MATYDYPSTTAFFHWNVNATTELAYRFPASYRIQSANDFKYGQGNCGWRNMLVKLPTLPKRIADLYVVSVRQWLVRRWIWLVQRSEPRWRAGRWKAKT